MNNTELKRHLRRKLERVTMLKLSLEGTVRELASEIISLNEELALVEGGKSSKKKTTTPDIFSQEKREKSARPTTTSD